MRLEPLLEHCFTSKIRIIRTQLKTAFAALAHGGGPKKNLNFWRIWRKKGPAGFGKIQKSEAISLKGIPIASAKQVLIESPPMPIFRVITLAKENEHQTYKIAAESFENNDHEYVFRGHGGTVASFPIATTIAVVDERAFQEAKDQVVTGPNDALKIDKPTGQVWRYSAGDFYPVHTR